jgi:hypothetical protein
MTVAAKPETVGFSLRGRESNPHRGPAYETGSAPLLTATLPEHTEHGIFSISDSMSASRLIGILQFGHG